MLSSAVRTFTTRSTLRAPPSASGSVLSSSSSGSSAAASSARTAVARPKRVAMMPLSSASFQAAVGNSQQHRYRMASDEPGHELKASPLPEGVAAGSVSATGKVSKFYAE